LLFCFALVTLVGSGTNASACRNSDWIKPVDNICYFGGWHHNCDFGGWQHNGYFGDWQHMGCLDNQNNDHNCGVEGTQETSSDQSTTTTTTTTTTSTTTTSSEQSTTTVEGDSGYSVVVGQTYTGAVGANVVPIAISIAIAGCVAGGFIVFIKKRP